MAWRFHPGASLTEQIADKIRLDIIGGIYETGAPFPTVRQLAFDASVNPNTMQKALCLLEEEGLLITLSTQGRIVTEDKTVIESAKERHRQRVIFEIIEKAKELSLSKEELTDYIEKGWYDNE